MINAANSSWTPARVELLVGLWVTDMNPEAIAKEMGGFEHTADGGRKSVIGKANRMKLPPKRVFADPVERERLAKARAEKRNEVRRQRRAEASASKPPAQKHTRAPVEPFLGSLNIAFADLRRQRFAEPNQCRFIEGEGPDYLACANETKPGKSYCDHHHAVCHSSNAQPRTISDADRARRIVQGYRLGRMISTPNSLRCIAATNDEDMVKISVDAPSFQVEAELA